LQSFGGGSEPGTQGSWNAWDWNTELFPDPAGFLRYAHANGIEIGMNLHPSINSNDRHFAATQEKAGGALQPSDSCRVVQADPTGLCHVFDWTDPRQLRAYFDLHTPFEQQGADFWWLDWCCDATRADAPGLTPDTFINWRYAERQRARGSRWPAFQRIGGSYQLGWGGDGGTGALAERRQTIQFTGDTCGTWEMLAFEPAFTAAAAAIGLPYVSHDIGSFHATPPNGICDATVSPVTSPRTNSLSGELYVRWMQLGVVQPLLRIHSSHGKRLPWEYPQPYERIAADALRLRGALVPYLYSAAAHARRTGAPMTRPLWLDWPRRPEAYEHDGVFMLGRDLLAAPVTSPGDPATVKVWFPPGRWTDVATGEQHRGPATKELEAPLDRIPLFARRGALVATQPAAPTTPAGSPGELLLTAYPGSGRSVLYDDAGDGLAYLGRRGSSRIRLRQRRTRRAITVTIGAERRFAGRPAKRTWTVTVRGVTRPARIVRVGGRRLAPSAWTAEPGPGIVTVRLGARPTRRATRVVVRLGRR
jgi:alpha-glucosidase (family GH31 glycosyl hydrolase)